MSLHLDEDYDEPVARHTELTLSTGVIVGALIALALLCALFFWFGYSMHGGGSKAGTLPTAPIVEPTSPDATFSSFKPAAGSPVNGSAPVAATPTPSSTNPTPSHPATPTPQPPAPVAVRPPTPAAAPLPAATPPQAANGFYVQVAAVSHQPDADKLAGTLHAEGYLVTARQSSQDSLFHVQIGPYASRKDADLIRQKLIGEGYTPIVK